MVILSHGSLILLLLLATLACTVGIVIGSPSSPSSSSPLPSPPCRFASLYSSTDLFTNSVVRSDFARSVAHWEGQFAQPNPCTTQGEKKQYEEDGSIGYHAKTGMTLDGHRLSIETGQPLPGGSHRFTAASKESLHVGLLAQSLRGNAIASTFLSPSDPTVALNVSLSILSLKVNTYDTFFETFPGFGGFLPWVDVNEDGTLTPTPDFNSSVPSLDNGQLFWSAYAVATVLRANYSDVLHQPMMLSKEESYDPFYTRSNTTLAERWENVVQRMIDNAMIVFYDASTNTSTGQFRTVSYITDRTRPIDPNMDPLEASLNYASEPGCSQCYLDDPYEGELFTNMAFLFSNWSWTGADRNSVWLVKRPKLQAVNYTSLETGIDVTVERGWWYSGHEKWKYFMMPYLSSRWNRAVFLAGEKVRTMYSVEKMLPSGFASVSGTADTDDEDTGYKSDCGIGEIAFNTVSNTDILTPYSFAALFLASEPHAYVWYHNYLLSERGQTCFGSLEGYNRTGTNFSPLVTWDTKITTLFSMAGGIIDIVFEGLEQTSIDRTLHTNIVRPLTPRSAAIETYLDLFVDILDREWSRVFDNSDTIGLDLGEDENLSYGFELPRITIPSSGWNSFPSCTEQVDTCQCQQMKEMDNYVEEEDTIRLIEEQDTNQIIQQ